MAAVNERVNTVTVYTWDTVTGSFRPTGGFAVGNLPVRIAAAQLTGQESNGHPLDDLVVANDFDHSVTIALQQPDGTFTTLTQMVGDGPADFTFLAVPGQVGPDIVVADQVSGDFNVLVNDATATAPPTFNQKYRFRAGRGLFDINVDPNTGEQTILSQLQTVAIAAGDFTEPGSDDLVALNRGAGSFTLFNLGKGGSPSPQPVQTYHFTSAQPSQVVPLTLPGESLPGLAVLMEDPGQIWIYANNGQGGFAAQPTVVMAGNDPTGLSVATVNGTLALLVGNSYGDILTLLYDGNGSFAPDRSNLQSLPLAVGTIDDTRQQFAVVANQDLDRAWLYYRIPGTNKFARPVPITSQSYPLLAPGAVQIFTVPGDPNPYLAVANSLSNNVLLYHYDPTMRGFDILNSIQVGDDPVSITVADINGDHVPDLLVANYGSNDVSVLIGSSGGGNVWQAQAYQRVSSGGSGPLAVAARVAPGSDHGPDLVVTNSNGQIVTVPGIGSDGQGSGFFQGNNPQTVSLGLPILHAAFDSSTGNEFLVLQDGQLIAPSGAVLVAADVAAVSATDNYLIVGLADGEVEVMTESGAGVDMERPDFIDQPSALQALLSGNQIDVYATYQDQQAPVLFSFAVPVITELPSTSAMAQASSLADTNLILTAVLLQGDLVERVEAESIPGEETFTQFARSTSPPLLLQNAAVNDNPAGEAPLLPDAELPVEAPLQSFRLGVEEALRQWLRDQQRTPRIDGMLEALQGMLPAPPESPDQPPPNAPAPAKQPATEPKQPAAEQEEQTEVNEQEPKQETAFPAANTDAEVEVFAGVDLLPVLAMVGWLMEREEEETANRAGS